MCVHRDSCSRTLILLERRQNLWQNTWFDLYGHGVNNVYFIINDVSSIPPLIRASFSARWQLDCRVRLDNFDANSELSRDTIARTRIHHPFSTRVHHTFDYKVLNVTMNLSNHRPERIIIFAEQQESCRCLLTFRCEKINRAFNPQFSHFSLCQNLCQIDKLNTCEFYHASVNKIISFLLYLALRYLARRIINFKIIYFCAVNKIR